MHLVSTAGGSDPTASRKPVVGLALPGGGAECAAQGGALIRVAEGIESQGLRYVGAGGASGGVLNIGFGTQGWVENKSAGVAHQLEKLWWTVGEQHPMHAFNMLMTGHMVDHSAGRRHDRLSRAPHGRNPIEWMVEQQLDFDVLRAPSTPTILVNTVLPLEGREKVTMNAALTPQIFAASAALPGVFNSINIKGRPHWDGGIAGTPVDPLYRLHPEMTDLIVIPALPSHVPHMTNSDSANLTHMRNLMWNQSWKRELFHLANMSAMDPQREAPLNIHVIDVADPQRDPLEFSWGTLQKRMRHGYDTAHGAWQAIAPKLGRESTYETGYEVEGFTMANNTIVPRQAPQRARPVLYAVK